jgi:hypothetical protein
MSNVAPPEQDQLVSIRSRQWVVNDVLPTTLAVSALKPSFSGLLDLLTPASIEDDALDEKQQVIREIESGVKVIEKVALRNRPISIHLPTSNERLQSGTLLP